jgi:uncharacterized membrane protein
VKHNKVCALICTGAEHFLSELKMVGEDRKVKEPWTRSLVKTITYRALIIILDFTFIYLLTGQYQTAFWFMLGSNIYTSVAYYVHERFWNRTSWGTHSKLKELDETCIKRTAHALRAIMAR